MYKKITVQGIRAFFSNKNDEMGLTGHSHYVEFNLSFVHYGKIGFPVFKETVDELKTEVHKLLLRPIRGTNEDVIELVHNHFCAFDFPATKKYSGCVFHFQGTEMFVMGVNDSNNHSEGFARYTLVKTIGHN